jgi:hypothetical protein
MNRVQVVGANGGGVAYSRAGVIPWKKRIDEGFYKQNGGGFFRKKNQTRIKKHQKGGFSRVIANMERRKKQKGGGWFARGFTGFSGATRGKNLEIENRRLQKEREKKQKGGGGWLQPRRGWVKQKGGGWFEGLSKGMFGIEQKRGKKKRKPAIIHSAATARYPQKGGFYGRSPKRDVEKWHAWIGRKTGRKVQKGGVLGLGKLEKWYGGKSKKERGEIDAWSAKNL